MSARRHLKYYLKVTYSPIIFESFRACVGREAVSGWDSNAGLPKMKKAFERAILASLYYLSSEGSRLLFPGG